MRWAPAEFNDFEKSPPRSAGVGRVSITDSGLMVRHASYETKLKILFFWIGAPLTAAGAAIVGGNILWFWKLNRQASINVTCPHCHKEYNVLPGFQYFLCDECKHEVPVPNVA